METGMDKTRLISQAHLELEFLLNELESLNLNNPTMDTALTAIRLASKCLATIQIKQETPGCAEHSTSRQKNTNEYLPIRGGDALYVDDLLNNAGSM